MRCAAVFAAVLLACAPGGAASPGDGARDRIWFAPAPAARDLLAVFRPDTDWPRARAHIDVFQFYQQHTFAEGDPIIGANTYEALAAAGAFRTLTEEWGVRIALEAGSVKEFYCTDDDTGMRQSIDRTLASVAAVEAAGGSVSYLAMDEPFLAGRSPRCGGPRLEPTADRLRGYMSAVAHARPDLRVGLIEAYPAFDVEGFAAMLRLMRERGVAPAFLHVDVYRPAVNPRRQNLARDMARLSVITAAEGVAFGVIVWGENGDDPARFAAEATALGLAFGEGFHRWKREPDHVVFQSWAIPAAGLERVVPATLPEHNPQTLSGIMLRVLDAWRAMSPPLVIER